VKATNIVGNSTPIITANVSAYTTPTSPSFDTVNTLAVASGNVKISLFDISNTSLNNVFYLYSIDGSTYSNSLVKANGSASSPYTFFIDGLSAQIYTVYVKATNVVGNSTPIITANVNAYTTPTSPAFDTSNIVAVASGNVKVSLFDISNTSLNNVFYLYSLDDSIYSNSLVKANGSANSPYSFFINGLSAQIYTIYVKSTNIVGNSTPIINTNVNAYTTPTSPAFDTVNTLAVASGNVKISLSDVSNTSLNNVFYLYSIDGTTYSNSLVKANGSANSPYTFFINNLTAQSYTIYVKATNVVGNSTPVSTNVNAYTTPTPPAFDTVNTLAVASGNVKISLFDISNTSLNNVFYLYSIDGTNYSNSLVKANGSASSPYSFFIDGLSAQSYTVYVKATNVIGNSTPVITANVNAYTTPITPAFDTANTQTISIGNVKVSLFDLSNTSLNNVFYLYSTDGTTYANSGAKANGFASSPYSFFIGDLSYSEFYTIYVKSTNVVGNSSPVITANVKSYITPIAPAFDTVNTLAVASGNVKVLLFDVSNTSFNNVFYLYSIDGSTYSNSLVKANGSASSPYSFFINNLSAQTYTVYVKATNIVGNSTPIITANVNAYTTPITPAFDNANISTVSSGNLKVTILDTYNTDPNNVYYWYSTDGITYSNTNVKSTGSSTNVFYISPLTDISYSIYVKAINIIGNSTAISTRANVFVTPYVPTSLTTANPASGSIRASFSDTNFVNYFLNDNVSYYYYLYGNTVGTDQSGNISAYIYSGNQYVNGITNYQFAINGLVENKYTLYVTAKALSCQ
jgi:hypothetical protein